MKPGDPDYGVEPGGSEGELFIGETGSSKPQRVQAPQGNYMAFYEGLHRSIVGDAPEPVTADDGVAVMRIIDAAYKSHRDGAIVSL